MADIREIIRAVTILVVFCPCALVLATPTAIMAAIGKRHKARISCPRRRCSGTAGICKKVAFDKTGTLTYGTPQVTAVVSYLKDLSWSDLYAYAASAELNSEHPLGKPLSFL